MTYNVSSGTLNPSIPYHTTWTMTVKTENVSKWYEAISSSPRRAEQYSQGECVQYVDSPDRRFAAFTLYFTFSLNCAYVTWRWNAWRYRDSVIRAGLLSHVGLCVTKYTGFGVTAPMKLIGHLSEVVCWPPNSKWQRWAITNSKYSFFFAKLFILKQCKTIVLCL